MGTKKKKKREPRKDKAILDFLNEIDWAFGLNVFEKKLVIEKEDDKNNTAAEVEYRQDYQEIYITIYPRFFKQTKAAQRKILLHELCHSITLPSKTALHEFLEGKLVTPERIRQINEEETSKIENLLHCLLTKRLRYMREAYANYLK